MSDGIKAMYEDEAEYDAALRKVGLEGDKTWGRTPSYEQPHWLTATMLSCARDGLNTEDTIRALHKAKHEWLAADEANKELAQRRELKKLQGMY